MPALTWEVAVKDVVEAAGPTVDNTLSIQAQIWQTGINGQITLGPGTHLISNTLVPLAGQTIDARGATLLRAPGFTGTMIAPGSAINGVTIRYAHFDNLGNGTTDRTSPIISFPNGSSQIALEDLSAVNIVDSTTAALVINFVGGTAQNSDVGIRRCRIIAIAGSFNQPVVVVNNPTNLWIEDNYIEQAGAIKIETSSNVVSISRNVNVLHNRIVGCDNTGILIRQNGQSTIEDILVEGNVGQELGLTLGKGLVTIGEQVGTGPSFCKRVRVIGNSAKYFKSHGINIGGGPSGSIVSDVVVSGNTIDASDLSDAFNTNQNGGGIQLTDVDGFEVTGNRVKQMGRSGIRLVGAQSGTVTGNSVELCVQSTTISAPDGNSEAGICLFNSSTRSCKQISISGNTSKNNGVATWTGTAGIGATATSLVHTGIQIVGNRCTDDRGSPAQAYGVRVGVSDIAANQPQNFLVADNDLRGNVTSQVFLVNAAGKGHIFKLWGAGAPGEAACIGSTWQRTDGGALTSTYFKETVDGGTTGWVGK